MERQGRGRAGATSGRTAARKHHCSRAWLGQGAVAVDRQADPGVEIGRRLYDARIFPRLPERRFLQFPKARGLRAEGDVGGLLGDQLRFAQLSVQAVAQRASRGRARRRIGQLLRGFSADLRFAAGSSGALSAEGRETHRVSNPVEAEASTGLDTRSVSRPSANRAPKILLQIGDHRKSSKQLANPAPRATRDARSATAERIVARIAMGRPAGRRHRLQRADLVLLEIVKTAMGGMMRRHGRDGGQCRRPDRPDDQQRQRLGPAMGVNNGVFARQSGQKLPTRPRPWRCTFPEPQRRRATRAISADHSGKDARGLRCTSWQDSSAAYFAGPR